MRIRAEANKALPGLLPDSIDIDFQRSLDVLGARVAIDVGSFTGGWVPVKWWGCGSYSWRVGMAGWQQHWPGRAQAWSSRPLVPTRMS